MFTIKDTLFIGKSFIDLPIIASTNAYAQQLINNSQPADGTIISTFNQIEGKGYKNNVWLSEPDKNLSFSLILYPKAILAHQQFFLNIAVSVAIAEVLANSLDKDVLLKWPNDIYYLNKKLGGVLIENSIVGKSISSSVIGIGINVNQIEFENNLPNPTSLKRINDKAYNLYQLLNDIVKAIESKYLMLQSGKLSELSTQYKSLLYAFNVAHKFKSNQEVFSGKIKGVDDFGRLLIESNGVVKQYHYKEIEYVFN